MNYNIFLVCLLLTGIALADEPSETSDNPTVEETTTTEATKTEENKEPAATGTPEEKPAAVEKKESDTGYEEKKTPEELASSVEAKKTGEPEPNGEVKTGEPSASGEVTTGEPKVGKLADLLNIETTPAEPAKEPVEPAKEPTEPAKEPTETKEKETPTENSKEKTEKTVEKTAGDSDTVITKHVEGDVLNARNDTLPKEVKTSSAEETGTVKKVETSDKENSVKLAKTVETSEKENSVKLAKTVDSSEHTAPKTKVVGTHNTESKNKEFAGHKPEHVEVPPPSNYIPGVPKPPADHKMTPIEQQAFVCSLPQLEGDLCPMTINLEENVGISDPGANAYCNDVIAAPMGYHGFCVVLSKIDPATLQPIYTRTCAYYDKERSKCSTNFLTSEPQVNATQVKYTCPNNGLTHYIPTSCCKKQKAHTGV
ncbi:hypothetical protein M8J77_007618 [Diaphorina citri]|nr:hypothetical protein M8J77_007618 [Diaphorina citri]